MHRSIHHRNFSISRANCPLVHVPSKLSRISAVYLSPCLPYLSICLPVYVLVCLADCRSVCPIVFPSSLFICQYSPSVLNCMSF